MCLLNMQNFEGIFNNKNSECVQQTMIYEICIFSYVDSASSVSKLPNNKQSINQSIYIYIYKKRKSTNLEPGVSNL